MCNILYLKPNVMPVEEEFENMCHNNWHSYGLVTLVDGKMDIKKKVPESGEINPSELWRLLEADIEYPRIVHVRHNTAGTTSLENCHPFDVFYQNRKDGDKQIVFMHNGTLYEYKSKKYNGTTMVDDDSGPSDTQNFVNRVLIPYISSIDFGTGKGDLDHPALQTLLKKFWPTTSNRGILISNDQEPFLLGDWKKTKGSKGEEILSANDDYFKNVIRGPEKARRDAEIERLKKEEAERRTQKGTNFQIVGGTSTNQNTPAPNIVSLAEFDFSKKSHGVYSLSSSFKNILNDYNVWDREVAVNLGAATQKELEELYDSSKKDTIILMDWIFADYASLYSENLGLEDKHKKASKHIADLKEEVKDLREALRGLGYWDKAADVKESLV